MSEDFLDELPPGREPQLLWLERAIDGLLACFVQILQAFIQLFHSPPPR